MICVSLVVEKFRAYVRDFEKFRQERAAKRRQAKLQQEEKAKQVNIVIVHAMTQLCIYRAIMTLLNCL